MISKVLDRLFPYELLPFGKRWRIAGTYRSPDTVSENSIFQRGLPWFKDCGLYLHHITKRDDDRHCHNHPYSFGSWILWGWYCEGLLTSDGVKNNWRRWLEFAYAPQERFHRVQELSPGGCWTLFLAGRPLWMIHPDTKDSVHRWGFFVDGQFMDWVTYRKRFGHNV